MKIGCDTCGVHFPEDFAATLAAECCMWGGLGLAMLPEHDKRIVWDWMFALPIDRIWGETGILVEVVIQGRRVDRANQWEQNNPAYTDMTDEQRKEYQRKSTEVTSDVDALAPAQRS